MASDGKVAAPSTLEITARVARYAHDRLAFAGPVSAVAIGTATVWSVGAMEACLFLMPQPRSAWQIQTRFVSRYAAYNIIPSLIWGTHAPSAIVASSAYLSKAQPTNQWLYNLGLQATNATSIAMPPKRVLWVKILCALRGAVAGTVVLSNVIALTSLWERARGDHAERIKLGREQPMVRVRSNNSAVWDPSAGLMGESGCTIRLAGVRSDVTELSLRRRGPERLWPVFENACAVQHLVSLYGCQDRQILPQVPVYWQVNDGEYSKHSSWKGMDVPESWLYTIQEPNGKKRKRKLLYLEADATSGGDSAISLQKHSSVDISEDNKWNMRRSYKWLLKQDGRVDVDKVVEPSTAYFDLDLKEVSQGFRRLADLARKNVDGEVEVMRVLLVDPTVVIESGGGRKTSVRRHVEELGLGDVIVDARGLVLKSILEWLKSVCTKEDAMKSPHDTRLVPVILETSSKAWFNSIRSELRRHGYDVIDRSETTAEGINRSPMLVYERSSADTVHTVREYLEQGIVKDPSRVCALLTCFDGLEEIELLNQSMKTPVGCICSSDIHDRALEWVRKLSVDGVSAETIQERLDLAQQPAN